MKLCTSCYLIGSSFSLQFSHWSIKITGTCNPFNCRGGFSLHVSTETRNEFQILARSNAEFLLFVIFIRVKGGATLITQCGNFLTSAIIEKCQSFSLEVAA